MDGRADVMAIMPSGCAHDNSPGRTLFNLCWPADQAWCVANDRLYVDVPRRQGARALTDCSRIHGLRWRKREQQQDGEPLAASAAVHGISNAALRTRAPSRQIDLLAMQLPFSPIQRVVTIIGMLMATSGLPALAQSVRGTVTNESDGLGIAEETILLLDSLGVARGGARTDAAGAWMIRAPREDLRYTIRVHKAGFATIETALVTVESRGIEMHLTTRPEVLQLEGVSSQRLTYDGILSRRDRRAGYILDADAIERIMRRIQPEGTARLLWGLVPGLQNVPGGGQIQMPRRSGYRACNPLIVIDGKQYRPRAMAALESRRGT